MDKQAIKLKTVQRVGGAVGGLAGLGVLGAAGAVMINSVQRGFIGSKHY